MVTFNLYRTTGNVGDRIDYDFSGLNLNKGFYITAIANYDESMNDYSLAQLGRLIIGRKSYRGSGGISSSYGWVDITEDIYNLNVQTLTIVYFDNYGDFSSLTDFEENVTLGGYIEKSEDYAVRFYNGKKLSGIVTWLKNWFNTKEEHDAMLFTDSGWVTCTPWIYYEVYTSGTTLRVRKIGKTVELSGIIKSTYEEDSTEHQIAQISTGYRPSQQQTKVCQGSGMNRWLLTVKTDGKMTCTRYGTTSYSSQAKGAWLPYTITYMVD